MRQQPAKSGHIDHDSASFKIGENLSMRIHHQFTFPLLLFTSAVAAVLSIIAARGNSDPGFVPVWSRKRESFTKAGWRYRNLSLWSGYIFFAVIVADQLLA